MGRIEWQRVCRAQGERKADSLTCPYLEEERCTVYEVRPLICRLWGLVESMPCPWGCKPERYLTHEEGHELLARAAEIQSGGMP
jgi:Fe-S-cluster containining protein